MKCPACSTTLKKLMLNNLEIDVCEGGCGGIWFDQFELERADEPHETLGEHLETINREPNVYVDQTKKRKCPRCENMVLMQHQFKGSRVVVIDECGMCGGIWLDDSEISALRHEYRNAKDRDQAADAYLDSMIDKQQEASLETARKEYEKAKKIHDKIRKIIFWLPAIK